MAPSLVRFALLSVFLVGCGSSAATTGEGTPTDPADKAPNGPPNGAGDGGGNEGGDGASDPSPDAGPPPAWTTPSAPPECDLAKPFGAPVALPGFTEADAPAGRATYSPDETIAFFGFWVSSDLQIASASRANRSSPFSGVAHVPSLVTTDNEKFSPSVSADGKTMFMSVQGFEGGLWRTRRPSVTSPWGDFTLVYDHVDNDHASSAFVQPDGAWVFISRFVTSEAWRFPVATSNDRTTYVHEEQITTLPAGDADNFVVAFDGLSLIYSKQLNNNADMAVYRATRASTSATFGAGVRLDEFPVSRFGASMSPDWLSPDGCRLYGRAVLRTNGPSVLVVATRPL